MTDPMMMQHIYQHRRPPKTSFIQRSKRDFISWFLIFIFPLLSLQLSAQVTYRDTLVSWSHFDYTLDEWGGMDWYSTTNIV